MGHQVQAHKVRHCPLKRNLHPGRVASLDGCAHAELTLPLVSAFTRDQGFMEGREEPEGYWLEVLQGQVPREMHGTWFR